MKDIQKHYRKDKVNISVKSETLLEFYQRHMSKTAAHDRKIRHKVIKAMVSTAAHELDDGVGLHNDENDCVIKDLQNLNLIVGPTYGRNNVLINIFPDQGSLSRIEATLHLTQYQAVTIF